MKHRIAVLLYPQGDRIVLLDGRMVYAEDPANVGSLNRMYWALQVAYDLAEALGAAAVRVVHLQVPAHITAVEEDSYERTVAWYNAGCPQEVT